MTGSRKSIARILSLVIASVIVCLVCASTILTKIDANTYPSNVWVGGINIGNLTREQALAALIAQSRSVDQLELQLRDKNLSMPFQELSIEYDCQATLAAVDESLYRGEGFGLLMRHSIVRGDRQEIAPAFKWDDKVLRDKMIAIKAKYDKPPLDARILYSNNYLEYVSHTNGYYVNVEQSLENITKALKSGDIARVTVSTVETYPRVRLDDIREVQEVIGIQQVTLPGTPALYLKAIQAFNGVILMPQDSISRRSISQASSALIDALKAACSKAGLKDKGQAILNDLDHPVLITGDIEGNLLTIRVFACRGTGNVKK